MKLAQRLMIGYYKTKLNTLGMLSPRKAAESAIELFCTPFNGRPKVAMPELFAKGESLSFNADGIQIKGFRFTPENPDGKTIVIAHGFSSYSYRFEKYISPLVNEGFTVLTFDAPAHGLSGGKLINAAMYRDVLLQIESLYGPVYGLMGHSLGGLAAALAFERFTEPEKRKLVLIAPATETETTLKGFFTMLPVDKKIQESFVELIEEIAGSPVSYFSVSRAIKNTTGPVLWVHDKNDPICPYKDVKPLLSLHLPHVRFLITEGLGHSKVYKDPAVSTQIVQFFNPDNT